MARPRKIQTIVAAVEANQERQEKINALVELAQSKDPLQEMEAISDGAEYKFRVHPNGKASHGHYVDGNKTVATGDGFKFQVIKQGGLFYMKNLDFGFFDMVTGEGEVEPRLVNVIGYKFEQPFRSPEHVVKAAADWLLNTEAKNQINAHRR